jgi:uncharacterized protein (DUF362 family)
MTVVTIADARLGLQEAFDDIFHPYGGLSTLIPDVKTKIFLKPNGIHFTAKSYTDPAMIEGLILYLKNLGYKRLALMEGSTGGNFTRLVFKICGYEDLCKKHNVEMIYLDEGPTVEVGLKDGTKTRISRRLWRDVINREGSFYFDLPKLKTHSMATLTLGVKNQQAFPIAGDRMQQHNHETLHLRLASLYAITRPDFCIIEGIDAVYHGHVPIVAFIGEQVAPLNILIGGQDTLAVDVVGARVLGYSLDEVEHLRLCAKWNLGEGDINKIQIKGIPLSTFSKKYPNTLLGRFHPDVRWVVGRTRACVEGCRGNTESILEMFTNDHHGKGGWSIVVGSGFLESDFDTMHGDILIVGPCAVKEVSRYLRNRFRHQKIFTINEHNDLMNNTRLQAKLSQVVPISLVPGNKMSAAWYLLVAKLHGLHARVPPILG